MLTFNLYPYWYERNWYRRGINVPKFYLLKTFRISVLLSYFMYSNEYFLSNDTIFLSTNSIVNNFTFNIQF